MSRLQSIPQFSPQPLQLTRFGTPAELEEAFGPDLHARRHELGFHTRVLEHRNASARAGHGVAAPYVAVVSCGGVFAGLAVRTPSTGVILSELPEAAVALVADDLRTAYGDLPCVLGPQAVSEAFARRWASRRGTRSKLDMRTELFVLDRLVPHEVSSGGRMVTAHELQAACGRDVARDLGLWGEAFAQEVGLAGEDPTEACVRERVRDGRMFVWLDDTGRPVSTACIASRGAQGTWINLVYTPPEFRGRGYARGLVAALSRDLLGDSEDPNPRFCFLFTDLGNRGARKMYERVGYRPIGRWAKVDFALSRKPGLLGLGGTLSLV